MLRNYLKVALRNTANQKLLSLINIFSLAFGIAACLIIFLFIQDERSFDAFHAKQDQLYRLNEVQSFPGTNTQHVALSMPGMGPNLQKDYPEVLNFTRYWTRGKRLFEKGDTRLIVEEVVGVDSTFLELFDFRLLDGDAATALDEPYSIVISEETAKKFFGGGKAMGESLVMNGKPYKITGIAENVPENSHLQFDVLLSIPTVTRDDPGFNEQFGSNYLVTYLLLDPAADVKALESRMPEFLSRYMPPDDNTGQDVNDFYKLYFQPLPDIHLASMEVEHDYQNYRKFNGAYLDIFAIVGLFILLIAAVNFMNLITARASHRWKEVGVRKTMGALKGQLFSQFAVESALLGVFAFILAMAISVAFTPLLNQVAGRTLSMAYFLGHPLNLALAFLFTLALGLLAGVYPSYYLASYRTVNILKGGDVKSKKSVFRSALVVLQFGLAIAMIVSTFTVVQQLRYMKNKDIGLNKDHILLVDMNEEANTAFETMKKELLKSSNIKGVTASGQRLGNNFHQWGFKLKTDSIFGMTPSNVNVDYDYLDVYEIKLKQGRKFSRDYATDKDYAFIINESLAQELGLEDPIGISAGHSWYPDDSLGTIIGVSEDFNFNSLHHDINTLAMVVHPDWGYDELSVKLEGGHIEAAIRDVERVWAELVPSWPFRYTFLDEHFEELYRSDQQMEAVVAIMAALAIFIACMGLFGLAAITVEKRTKEVGIRKVLGASAAQIVVQLSKNFALLVLLAFIVFSPLAFWAMNRWLENFAYRIEVSPLAFLLGGFLALAIALLTVSVHTLRSARVNPAEVLRSE
ncbi:MAG: ABC transporter permease [Lewinellaceae bacterium]|nr:ABC transporter permease [Phaeodactylibacter sp.]MCB9035725.1 ABC transporter permease [Lewinellaceae bacterium]